MEGCGPIASLGKSVGIIIPPPAYSGPKARIAVTDFTVQAAKVEGDVGTGLRQMLVKGLINSNRFLVVERKTPASIAQEEAFSALGSQTAPAADLIITATVAEFEPRSSGGRAGLGGGGGSGSGLMGGLLGASLNKTYVAMDIRIVDASTSEVLSTSRLQGQAADNAAPEPSGNWALGEGLSGYAHTPMEKAIQDCVKEAVRYISGAVPAGYYKY